MAITPIRVAVIHDEHLTRAGLGALLTSQPGFTVVFEAADLGTALSHVPRVRPDVILAGCHVGGVASGRALRLLWRAAPGSRVLALVPAGFERQHHTVLAAGAVGCITPNLSPHGLFAAIRQAVGMAAEAAVNARPARCTGELTPREREVAKLVCQGLYNREISHSLMISPNTVKIHLRNILAKMHLTNRIQVAAMAQQYPELLLRGLDPVGCAESGVGAHA